MNIIFGEFEDILNQSCAFQEFGYGSLEGYLYAVELDIMRVKIGRAGAIRGRLSNHKSHNLNYAGRLIKRAIVAGPYLDATAAENILKQKASIFPALGRWRVDSEWLSVDIKDLLPIIQGIELPMGEAKKLVIIKNYDDLEDVGF